MTHMFETKGPTINEQIEAAAAEVIFARMTEEEINAAKPKDGFSDIFGEPSKTDIVREAVLQAQREGARYKYGSYAKMIFALPDADQ